MSIKSIAAKIGLSSSPTYERINRLQETGVIEKYVVLLNKEKIGLGITVYCHVRLSSHSAEISKTFEEQIVQFENVIEIVGLSGNYDYMLKVTSNDMKDYQNFVDTALAQIPGIANIQSAFVMKTLKETSAYPLTHFRA